MKRTIPVLLIFFYSCGNGISPEEQKRLKDSLDMAKLDSIATAKKIEELKVKYVAIDSSKNELQKQFDNALTRLDSLTGYNNELEGKLNDRTNEISKLKGQISSILKKQRLSESEKSNVQALLTELNIKVGNLIKAVSKLK